MITYTQAQLEAAQALVAQSNHQAFHEPQFHTHWLSLSEEARLEWALEEILFEKR